MLVYLDNSATTRAYDEVIALMSQMQKEEYGNPSSLHTMGLAAEKRLRAARRSLALALCAREEEVYFTSGGTESDNTVLAGLLALASLRSARRWKRLLSLTRPARRRWPTCWS